MCRIPDTYDGWNQVHRRTAHEGGDERVGRAVVDVVGGSDLLHFAFRHHAQPVPQRHGLHLIMGDVNGGDREFAVQTLEVAAYLVPKFRIQIRQWFVEEECLRLANERAPHGHPLALAAGQLTGFAVQKLTDLQQFGRFAHPPLDLGSWGPALPKAVRQIAVHRHVRVERIVLEHHRDVALSGSQAVDHCAADPDLAGGRLVETGR